MPEEYFISSFVMANGVSSACSGEIGCMLSLGSIQTEKKKLSSTKFRPECAGVLGLDVGPETLNPDVGLLEFVVTRFSALMPLRAKSQF